MKLSIIFEPEPVRWGFRGDPWFWRYLKNISAGIDLPVDPGWLDDFIRKEHKRLSGEALREGSMARVPQFEHGGMTSGGISGTFWMNVGIPLLKQRLENVNKTLLRGSSAEEEGETGR